MSYYIQWVKEGEPGYYRIVEYIQCLKKYISWGTTILEVGTWYPYISDYFRRNMDCKIIYIGLENRAPETEKFFRKINLCRGDKEQLGAGWDVVTATEVLEHLPCDLYKVRDKLVYAVRKGGLLLVTSPVLGIGRDNTKLEDDLGDYDRYRTHIKEFRSIDEFKGLFNLPELQLIEEWFAESRELGSGSYCYNLLYRKV